MHTPDIFEQIAQGMSDPKKISQWLNQSWPAAVDGGAATAQTRAWIGSLESLLQGAEALRQLQLDAIHKTQRRTSELARSLRDARSPADTVAALQSFAQANMEDAIDNGCRGSRRWRRPMFAIGPRRSDVGRWLDLERRRFERDLDLNRRSPARA